MDVIVVTGFLGAGKTTLLKHLLESGIDREGRLAVIVNEVGEVGIDGTLLAGQNVDMVELTSGCICCTIQTDFRNAVQEIRDRVDPTVLVVEATGVAQPADILDVLFYSPLREFTSLKSLVTVVDADFFRAREVLGTFYTNQIRFADTIVLNKIDLVDPSYLDEVKDLLQQMNSESRVITTKHCNIDPAELILKSPAVDRKTRPGAHDHHHHSDWGFESFSFTSEHPLNRDRLVAFLDNLPPTIFRLKGWARFPDESALVDVTWGRHRLEPAAGSRKTSMTFVGRNCNKAQILKDLEGCLNP
jgi:G3E family GTPase